MIAREKSQGSHSAREGGPRGSGEEGQEDEADAADTDAAGVGGEIVDLIAKASRARRRGHLSWLGAGRRRCLIAYLE